MAARVGHKGVPIGREYIERIDMKDLIIRNLKFLRKAAGWKTEEVVLIGHSKTFVPYNEKTLEPFLRWVAMA